MSVNPLAPSQPLWFLLIASRNESVQTFLKEKSLNTNKARMGGQLLEQVLWCDAVYGWERGTQERAVVPLLLLAGMTRPFWWTRPALSAAFKCTLLAPHTRRAAPSLCIHTHACHLACDRRVNSQSTTVCLAEREYKACINHAKHTFSLACWSKIRNTCATTCPAPV